MKGKINEFMDNFKKFSQSPNKDGQALQPQGNDQMIQDEHSQIVKFNYLECPKTDEHAGELLNLVCVDPQEKGLDHDTLICCLCQDSYHNGHNVKSLKSFLKDCQNIIQQKKQDDKEKKQLDKVQIFNLLNKQEKDIINEIRINKEDTIAEFDNLEKVVLDLFQGFRNQVEVMQVSETDLELLLNKVYESQQELNQLTISIKQLIDVIPNDESTLKNEFETSEIINQLTIMNSDNLVQLASVGNNLKKQIGEIAIILKDKQKIDIFHPEPKFSFSGEYKHSNVSLISPTIVKASTGSNGYKFAVMTPSLDYSLGKPVKFGFKMKEINSSNWLAIGMCHLQTIVNKQYAFGFSQLGHGAYMISSNGGSWSSTKSQFNNVVKTFKFVKNDVIYCYYDPKQKTITFKHAKTNETYKLDFVQTNEHLHPCALFYYINDEVEFLQPNEVDDL